MYVFASYTCPNLCAGYPQSACRKKKIEVNANNAVQKLNRYTLLSLAYTRALYMFNNPKMECTKDKQLAVYPRRDSRKNVRNCRQSCHPPHRRAANRRRGKRTQVGKTYGISGSSQLNATDIRPSAHKSGKSSHGKGHMCTYTVAVLTPHADPWLAHMEPRPLLIRD